jgi:hypothetical protein
MFQGTIKWNKHGKLYQVSFITPGAEEAGDFIAAQTVLFTLFYTESENMKGRDDFSEIVIDGRMILKRVLKE